MNAPLACAALASLVAFAPSAAAGEASDEPPATGLRSEPRVQRTVIEDDGARIEELRVRGQTQRISVTPKGGPITKPYEIIPADGGRDPAPYVPGSRGAAGQRVWHVLSF